MIVLFTSGEYSDYGLSGLLEVDEKAYLEAKAKYEALGAARKALQKELKQKTDSGDITRNQTADIVAKMDNLRNQRYGVWEALRQTGNLVEFVEFWHGGD